VLEVGEDEHYETGEREQLCTCIDEILTGTGVDVEALCIRHGLSHYQITGRWRAW
jgi:hypothetical protein